VTVRSKDRTIRTQMIGIFIAGDEWSWWANDMVAMREPTGY